VETLAKAAAARHHGGAERRAALDTVSGGDAAPVTATANEPEATGVQLLVLVPVREATRRLPRGRSWVAVMLWSVADPRWCLLNVAASLQGMLHGRVIEEAREMSAHGVELAHRASISASCGPGRQGRRETDRRLAGLQAAQGRDPAGTGVLSRM